jgi:hypothetical protein
MQIEIKGKVKEITQSDFVGNNQTEKFTIVLSRKYIDMNEEEKEHIYAIQVFANNQKKSRSFLMYFLGKRVTCKATVQSQYYTKDGKTSFFTNLNFNSIEENESFKKDSHSDSVEEEKSEFEKNKENKTEEESTGDLPF